MPEHGEPDSKSLGTKADTRFSPGNCLFTVEDVARFLRVTPDTVRAMARRGELRGIKMGKKAWRFEKTMIEQYLKEHSAPQSLPTPLNPEDEPSHSL